jgi:transcriptional regulator with XRE-family HTH domain
MTFQVIREPEFAKRVTERREKLGMYQAQCAEEMGVSRQHWNNWEIGYCKPKGKRLRQLATLLKCDPVWLQHGDGSEVGDKLEKVMTMMRIVVRDLDHIHKALAK